MWLPDALRGLALLNMLAYHGMYDWCMCSAMPAAGTISGPLAAAVWQQYICWSFIVLSGFSFRWQSGPQKRADGGGVRGGADVCDRGIHAVGGHLVRRSAPKRRRRAADLPGLSAFAAPARDAGLAASAALFALTNQLPEGYLGFENWRLCAVPAGLYRANLFWLGLPDLNKVHVGGLFPRSAVGVLVLVRCVSGRALEAQKGRGAAVCARSVGRNTLFVYMLHQPVIYGVLWVGHAVMGR